MAFTCETCEFLAIPDFVACREATVDLDGNCSSWVPASCEYCPHAIMIKATDGDRAPIYFDEAECTLPKCKFKEVE